MSDVLMHFNYFVYCHLEYMIKVIKNERQTSGLDKAGERCPTQSLFVLSGCEKIVQKAPFGSMGEPGRLILVKVILEMEWSSQKSRVVLCCGEGVRKNWVSRNNHGSHLSALRLPTILFNLRLCHAYTFVIHLISLLNMIMN